MHIPLFGTLRTQTLACSGIIGLFIVFSASLSQAASAPKEINPSAKPLVFGMSTALSGPAQYLGHSMRNGVLAAFERTQLKKHRIQNRSLKLHVKDDSYQPDSALSNVKQLIQSEQVLALIGNVGTPTAAKTAPYANSQQVPFFAAYTGAAILRQDPPQPYVINLRAGYEREAEVIIRYILNQGIKPTEIAFLLQGENEFEADDYGKAGYGAARKALKTQGFTETKAKRLFKTYYPRNTLSINSALKNFLRQPASPRAIIIVGAYAPSAKFINYAQSLFTKTLFFNLSFTGASALAKELQPHSDRVFITQVVPQISPSLKISQDFEQDMKKFLPGKPINAISFEGYLAGRALIDALHTIDGDINRDSIRIALNRLKQDQLKQDIHEVWLAKYDPRLGFTPVYSN